MCLQGLTHSGIVTAEREVAKVGDMLCAGKRACHECYAFLKLQIRLVARVGESNVSIWFDSWSLVRDRTKVVLNMFSVSIPMCVIPDGSLSSLHEAQHFLHYFSV